MAEIRLAIDPTRPPAVLRLKEGSLPDLVGGQYVLRVWLRETEEDGVYTLHARTAGDDPRVEGLVRAILWNDTADGEPPIPEPTEEVAEIAERWMAAFVAMAAGEAEDGERIDETLLPWERLKRAEAVVREQRDPEGHYGAVGNPDFVFETTSVNEALLEQELRRLQRAVLGEPDPDDPEPASSAAAA